MKTVAKKNTRQETMRELEGKERGQRAANKRRREEAGAWAEITVGKRAWHKNIVPLIEVLTDPRSGEICLVMEIQSQGVLIDKRVGKPLALERACLSPVARTPSSSNVGEVVTATPMCRPAPARHSALVAGEQNGALRLSHPHSGAAALSLSRRMRLRWSRPAVRSAM